MSRDSWPVPLLWPDGPTAVIIGGGPSFDLAQNRLIARATLENKCRVIAVNDAIYGAWWADWLHGCDIKWWMWHRETVTKFPGIRTTCTETVPEAWAKFLRVQLDKQSGYSGGFPEEPDTVAGGGNGGYQAIQIAVKAGARRVVLVGFDMHDITHEDEPGRAHWFGDHPDRIRSDYSGTMLPYFPTLIEPLAERGVEIFNATPNSALKCFPWAPLPSIL